MSIPKFEKVCFRCRKTTRDSYKIYIVIFPKKWYTDGQEQTIERGYMDMNGMFFILAGGLLIIIIAVVIAVVASVTSAVAAENSSLDE